MEEKKIHPLLMLIIVGVVWTLLCLMFAGLCLGATIVWEGDVSAAWTTGGNWTGDTPPGVSDVAHFNGVLDNNCVLDASVSVLGIQVDVGYTGTIDFTNSAYTVTVGSSGVVIDGGTIDLGDATFAVTGGDWDVKDAASWTYDSSTVTFSGTSAIVSAGSTCPFQNLTIDSGSVVTVTGDHVNAYGEVIVNGSLSIVSVNKRLRAYGELVLGDGGRLTGASRLSWCCRDYDRRLA